MLSYIARRIFQTIPVLMGVFFVCFILFKATDPVRVLAKQGASDQERAAIRKKLHLDKGWHVQIYYFAKDLLSGNLQSYKHEQPVVKMVWNGAKITFKIALGAFFIAVTFGLLLGMFSAYKPRSLIDYCAASGASIGVSIPAFWLAMLLILLLAKWLRWLPPGQYVEGEIEYLVIPVLTLGFISMALIARISRNCMIETYSQDYVRTARAKGVSESTALVGHAFPNAMLPIVTVIGTNLAGLMTGAVLTETTCSVQGLGYLIFKAIDEKDHPVILGGCLFFAVVFIAVNLLVDVLYGVLDPRVRRE